MAQKNVQPKTQPEVFIEEAKALPETSSPRSGASLFALARGTDATALQAKAAFMGDIRQKLAQVADTAKQAGEEAAETEKLADMSATRLYQARIRGLISADELSGLLGDVFGYKPKQDGTPGKTPAGAGETIRKRIVRAVQGHDFVNGGDGGRFFETLDASDVAPIINSIGRTKTIEKDGQKEIVPDGPSIWSAYKLLGDIKSQTAVRLPFAFDPKKIMGLVDALSESGARQKLIANPTLLRTYAALVDTLNAIGHVDASEVETVAEALGVETPSAEPAETETETEEEENAAE